MKIYLLLVFLLCLPAHAINMISNPGGGSGGISSLNGLTPATQSFATGTAGSDFGISSSGSTHTFNLPTASASSRGALSTTDWSTFNSKQASLGFTPENVANKSTDGTFTANSDTLYPSQKAAKTYVDSKVFSFSQIPSPQRTLVFYVDNGRSDSYTADGSILRPYKTIQAAINAISTNSVVTVYVANGTYSENISINNASLIVLNIIGLGFVHVGTGVGNSISCTANNTNLTNLAFRNILTSGPVVLSGDINNTFFCNNYCLFQDSLVGGLLTSTNTQGILTENSILDGGLTMSNTGTSFLYGGPFRNSGTLTLVTNNANPAPSGFSGTELRIQSNTAQFSSASVDAGSLLVLRPGTLFGSSGGSLSLSGTLQAFAAVIRSNITLAAGSTLNDHGAEFLGTFTDGGATITADAAMHLNTLKLETSLADPSILDLSNAQAVDVTNRQLLDLSGAGFVSVDWQGRVLIASDQSGSADWQNRQLLDAAGTAHVSVDWLDRLLLSPDQSGVFDWSTNGQITANAKFIINNDHIKSTQTTPPVATVSANAGTGATCTVSNATDTAGKISITTGTVGISTGSYCSIAFNKIYGVAPICLLTPASSALSTSVYVTSTTTTMDINFAVAGGVTTTYVENYHCIETQ